MNCNKCGTNLGENDMFCPSCGTPVQKVDNTNSEIKNENMYTYERGVNQQLNSNQQQPTQPLNQNYGQANNYGQYNNYGQASNYAQPSAKSKNTGDIVRICIAVAIAILIIGVIGFIGYSIGSSANKKDDGGEVVVDNPTNTSPSATGGDYGTLTPTTNNTPTSSYKVNYAGFQFYIPDNLIYEVDYINEGIIIGNEEMTWVATMQIERGSFQDLKGKIDQLKPTLIAFYETKDVSAIISDPTIEIIDGVEYIIIESNLDGECVIMAMASLNSMYTVGITIVNENNDYNKEALKDFSKIISNAQYTGETQYIQSNENIKITDVQEAFKKFMEEKVNE